MIIVADTSPINYLVLIEQIDLLPAIFVRVVIPEAVVDELRSAAAPEAVRQWLAAMPDWLEVRTVSVADESLAGLGAGESEAIALAQLIKADLIVIDDGTGRRAAQQRGLRVTGTIGVLRRAAELGLLDFPEAIGRLRLTNFRISPRLLATLLAQFQQSD